MKHAIEIRVRIGEAIGEASLTMEVDDDDPECWLDAQDVAEGLADALMRTLGGEEDDDAEDLFAFASRVVDEDDGGGMN